MNQEQGKGYSWPLFWSSMLSLGNFKRTPHQGGTVDCMSPAPQRSPVRAPVWKQLLFGWCSCWLYIFNLVGWLFGSLLLKRNWSCTKVSMVGVLEVEVGPETRPQGVWVPYSEVVLLPWVTVRLHSTNVLCQFHYWFKDPFSGAKESQTH